MIDSDSKKEFRTFGIPANSQSIKMNNELLFFALQGDQLVKIDQKGNQQSLGGGWTDFDLTEVQTNEGKIWIVLHNSTTVKLVDESGRSWHTINTNAREIDALDINFKQGSNSLISVVDGLENDVYLYSLNGQVIGNSSFEGGSICFADEDALGARILTTVVDDFVVQHTIK
jgi:hypothetical protein